jgi:DNA-binding IclR family transcriptional regulator
VPDGLEVMYVVRRTPDWGASVSNIRVGSRLPAHASVMGRIILAALPPDAVERMYRDAPMPASTPHTPVTPRQLAELLARDRAAGVAWSDGFFEAGISSVAAAVFDATGAPVAALNVSGHTALFEGQERRDRIAHAVRAAAEEISCRLGWTAHPAARANPTTALEKVA